MLKRISKIFASLFLACILFCSANAAAQSRSVALRFIGSSFSDLILDNSSTRTNNASLPRLSKISPRQIVTYIPGEGLAKIFLTAKRNKNWRASITTNGTEVEDSLAPILLRGHILIGRKHSSFRRKQAIALSLIPKGDNYEMVATFIGLRHADKGHERVYTLKANYLAPQRVWRARISSIPSHLALARTCDTDTSSISNVIPALPASLDAIGNRVVEIATDTDAEWAATYGSSSNAEIAAIIDLVEVIYVRDLAMQFNITAQHTFSGSSPFTSTDSSLFLGQFRSYTNTNHQLGSADLYHLFSGKTLDFNVAGIAYVGVTCADPSYSYGTTTDFGRALNAIISTHEIGHNFNAAHDSVNVPSVMNPSVSLSTNTFSSTSISQISSFVTSSGSCLATISETPTASPTPTVSQTPSPSPTTSPSPTLSPTPTLSPVPTESPEPTQTAEPTVSPSVPPQLVGARLGLSKSYAGTGRYRLTARFRTAGGSALSGYSVQFFRNSISKKRVRTSSGGLASFITTLRGSWRAQVQSSGITISSSSINLRIR